MSSEENSGRLAGRVALITGASRGIGRAVALRYAQEGATVVLVARTQGALEELDDEIRALGQAAVLVPMDVTDFDKIDQVGAALYERFKRLDILVGNAGALGMLGPMGHIPPDEWDRVVAINLTANWRMLRSFDPLLRQSDAGRVIFVTSLAARRPNAYWGTYAVTKAALEMMAKVYAIEVEKTAVRVNLLSPGPTRTRMRAEAYPGEDPETLKTPESLAELFVEMALPSFTKNGEVVSYA
jgi:NAD(P)-dependent dehydrogenase (short-subunit alcohol dehydrogenase family)